MSRFCEKKTLPRRRARWQSLGDGVSGLRFADPGLTPQEAVEEAKRCLGSQVCEFCEICSLFCPDLCITRDEATGKVFIDLDYCKECGICASVCPKKAILMVKEE